MLKNILNLEGTQELTKNEQKEINGGLKHYCNGGLWCRVDADCLGGVCFQQCCEII
ncbi:hypothetical protein FLJC2902T_01660 [Flavobacterium limnosediminis JC2902]|uniref:Uncharacterized protein n=1 Tax=Flavobacterium limnosediminis JC2902 TaxID=1341181 RepID=V6SSM7_9FLAO|nr:hypothetical protein [Flavobacterium limnosediminis]ESU29693.1 hypothetical protein FLJC2902T_01660 [Flavobacterium limnosediminis JC2902]